MNSLFHLIVSSTLGTTIVDSTSQYHPSVTSTALKMLTGLGLVLGSLILAVYVMKRIMKRQGGALGDPLVRVLGNTAIGIKKSIALVEIPGAILVLGISNDSICLLNKIEDEETLHTLRRRNGGKGSSPFAAQLHEFTLRFRKEKNGK